MLPQVITPEDDTWQDSSEILDNIEGGLDDAGRAAVDKVMAGTGVDKLLAFRPRHQIDRRNYQFAISDT